jgi:quinol monooxygenase YgiN
MNDVDEGRPEDAETVSATSANGASSPGSEVAMARSSAVIEFKGGTMMSAFEVRARLKVRDGQLEAFKRHAAEMMRQTREKDTGTLAYDWFLSNDGTQCEVHEAYVDPDALVEHAFHVREAREALFATSAYDHKMAFYGDPSPRLLELVDKVGVDVTSFTLLQALEPASIH